MVKKAFFFGYLAENNQKFNGQTIRTRNVKRLLAEKLNYNVTTYDTIKLRKNPFSVLPAIINMMSHDSIFILLAHRGVRFLLPLICFLGWVARKKIYFVAIGGWLPNFIEKYYWIKWSLRKTSLIFVQSRIMADTIKRNNPKLKIEILPNFKFHNFNSPNINIENSGLRLVYISQISIVKGVDMVNFLMNYCRVNNLPITIDLFGPIKKEDELYVEKMLAQNPLINYLGILTDENLFDKLSTYDLMLFPTHHLTEGFPGVILDAFISGVPIMASRWNYGPEFINKEFGFLYEHDNNEEALELLLYIFKNKTMLSQMRQEAYLNRDKYAVSQISRNLERLGL